MKTKARKQTPRLMRIIIVIFMLIAVFTIIPRALQIIDLQDRRDVLAAQNQTLIALREEREIQLETIESLSQVERIAREQLGMIKEGERPLIRMVPEK